jgi:hypothetical protein
LPSIPRFIPVFALVFARPSELKVFAIFVGHQRDLCG